MIRSGPFVSFSKLFLVDLIFQEATGAAMESIKRNVF